MPIDARFFIENKEIIGLWIIYSIAMMLAYCILDTLFSYFKTKLLAKKKVRKVSEFDRAVERARVSSQIRAVMNVQL